MYEGGGGGGVLKNKCPYGAMYNFVGEKFSSSSDKHYIIIFGGLKPKSCLLYTSPSPRDQRGSRMPSSA